MKLQFIFHSNLMRNLVKSPKEFSFIKTNKQTNKKQCFQFWPLYMGNQSCNRINWHPQKKPSNTTTHWAEWWEWNTLLGLGQLKNPWSMQSILTRWTHNNCKSSSITCRTQNFYVVRRFAYVHRRDYIFAFISPPPRVRVDRGVIGSTHTQVYTGTTVPRLTGCQFELLLRSLMGSLPEFLFSLFCLVPLSNALET